MGEIAAMEVRERQGTAGIVNVEPFPPKLRAPVMNGQTVIDSCAMCAAARLTTEAHRVVNFSL